MASAWADYTDFTKQPPGDPDPGMADPIGHAHFAAYAASQESAATQSGSTAKPGTAPDAVNRPQQQNYTPYTPTARNAYGPYLTGDISNRTLNLDPTTRVDPYSGQRYNQGSDGTWRESGFLTRDQQSDLLKTGALAPTGQDVRAQTGAMPGNPGLRGGAGQAGMGGTLGPRDAPNFSSLGSFQIPGLGFNAGDYRQVQGVNLDSVKLPTTVTPTNYGFDFGHPPSFQGTKSYGPAESGVTMPNYQVPNNYMGGPSGFTQSPSGQAFFQPMAVPFNLSSPTFADLSKSAPAQIQPTMPPATQAAAATPNPDNAIRTSAPGPNLTSALGHPVADYSSRGYIPGAAAQPGAAQPGAAQPGAAQPGAAQPQPQQFTGPAQPQVTPGAGGAMTVNGHNLSPEVVSAVTAAFQQVGHPEAIPQMLAIAARESGGDPTADNSKSGPGGTPLNNQYQKPDSPYYNTVDYGLFGINEKNFANLGLTKDTAKDPVANANAAAKLYADSGFRPWTGGGTVPLPPVANGGQSTPGAPGAAGAAGANWDYFPALGPGETKPGGMTAPGGGGALYINGPQTAEIRNGGTGMGFNMDTILKDYGRSAIAPQDPIGKAVAALSLMNAQNSLLSNKDAPAKTPLDAFLSLTTPSTSNYGAPTNGNLPPGQAAPTSGLTSAQIATLGQQAAAPTGSQTGPAPGSPGAAPSSSQAADQAAAQAAAQAQAQAAQDNGERDDQQYYAQGGTVQVVGPPRMKQADSYRRFAAGGNVTTDPAPGLAPPLDSGRATPSVVAPLDDQSAGGMAQPRYTAQGQQQAQQASYLDSTAQAAGPSNSQAGIAPITNQATTSAAPTAQNTALPQTMAGGNTPDQSYTLDAGGNDPNDALAPFRDALTKLGVLSRQRAADAGRFSAAGLASPTGIDTMGGGPGGALPPGMFYDPSSSIKGRANDITNLQNTLAGLGNGNIDQLTGQMVPLQQLQSLFGNIDTMRNQLAAYGQTGDPSQYNAQMDAIDAMLSRYSEAQGIQTKLAGLGQVQDPGQYGGQQAYLDQLLSQYGLAEKDVSQLSGLGQVGDPNGTLNAQMVQYQGLMQKYQDAQKYQQQIAALGNPEDQGQLNLQMQQLQQAMQPYQKEQDLWQQLKDMGQSAYTDPNVVQQNQNHLADLLKNVGQPGMDMYGNPTEAGVQDINTGQWFTQSQLQLEMQKNDDLLKAAQQSYQLNSQLYNLDPNYIPNYQSGSIANQLAAQQTQMQGLQSRLTDAQSSQQDLQRYQSLLSNLGVTGDFNAGYGQAQNQYTQAKTALDAANAAQGTQTELQQHLASLGLGGQSLDQLYQAQGGIQTQRDQMAQAYQNALQQQSLQSQYQNQLSGLVPQGQDVNAAMGQLQAQRGGLAQQLSDAQKAQELQTQLGNLQGQTGGQTEAGVQSQLTSLTDALSRARQAGTAQTTLSNLLAQGVPGAGKGFGFAGGGTVSFGGGNQGPPDVQGYQRPPDSSGKNRAEMMRQMGGLGVTAGQWDPNWNIHQNPAHFAGGGNWIAGATQNSHGQFRAKAQAAGMSTGAYASKMADAPGRTGKQARLAKTLMSMHAGGGSMVTQEPIVGVGTVTGKPRFMVGEPHYPGGPPMKERLKITPLNKPNTRLPGGSHRAA